VVVAALDDRVQGSPSGEEVADRTVDPIAFVAQAGERAGAGGCRWFVPDARAQLGDRGCGQPGVQQLADVPHDSDVLVGVLAIALAARGGFSSPCCS
jgi:hypothetical protein